MRSTFAFFLLALATLAVVAQANDCVVASCGSELRSCLRDPVCSTAVTCIQSCGPSNPACARTCTAQATSDEAFANVTSCAAQCSPDQSVWDLADDLLELEEPRLLGKCGFLKKAACAVAIGGAVAACGGPEDLPCIIKALKALHGCAKCFCEDHGCKDLCKHIC